MDVILTNLIEALGSALTQLDAEGLHECLHDTENLPDKRLVDLSSNALDMLENLRLRLEPRQLILADHFMGEQQCEAISTGNANDTGYMNTKALCAAVELKIPDLLHSRPKTLCELAELSNAREDRLRQVMRMLSNNGIFHYIPRDATYANNSTSTLLLSNHWTQWRNWVDLYGNEFYDMARGLQASCARGAIRSPAQINYNTDSTMFQYFSDQGWLPKFHKTLSGGAIAQAPGIVHDYPWNKVARCTVLDVGGGSGGLIASLLRAYPDMKGGIFDTPKVITQAAVNFHTSDGVFADVGKRVSPENLMCGDFQVEVPSFEVYTMKWCLHDWNDNEAVKILKTIRRAIKVGRKSRLVILESVLRDGHMGRMARYGDMNMMIAVSGKERDESEWQKLADESGWALKKIFPLRNAWPCAIEFTPAELAEKQP